MELIRAEFKISGHVQGVGFRYFVYQTAQRLGIKGQARNIYDGTVEVIAEGEKASIDRLAEYLRQGPSRSRVDSCKVNYTEYKGDLNGFGIG